MTGQTITLTVTRENPPLKQRQGIGNENQYKVQALKPKGLLRGGKCRCYMGTLRRRLKEAGQSSVAINARCVPRPAI